MGDMLQVFMVVLLTSGHRSTVHSNLYTSLSKRTQNTTTSDYRASDSMGDGKINSFASTETIDNRSSSLLKSAFTSVTALSTGSPEIVLKKCNGAVCKSQPGHFFINGAFCPNNTRLAFHTTRSFKVDILLSTEISNTECLLYIYGPGTCCYMNVTIDKVKPVNDDNSGSFALRIKRYDELVFNDTVLKNHSVNFLSTVGMYASLKTNQTRVASILSFRVEVEHGIWERDLPVVKLSDSVGYVTSPQFKDTGSHYERNYDGFFRLDLARNESVLISFTLFSLEAHKKCNYDYVELSALAQNLKWRKCGMENIPLQVYRSSIQLYFHSDGYKEDVGFKMMYAIFPTSQEPQQISTNLYNCSVPYFQAFKPLLSCNFVKECQKGEDEEDCGYQSDQCKEGDISAGSKCYSLFRHKKETWTDAQHQCIQNGQTLPILGTADEYRHFVRFVSSLMGSRSVYVGAQLTVKQQPVPIRAMYRGVWQWTDDRTAFVINTNEQWYSSECGVYSLLTGLLTPGECHENREVDLICEYNKQPKDTFTDAVSTAKIITTANSKRMVWNVSVVHCPLGHVTKDFLSCNTQARCGGKEFSICQLGDVTISMFSCHGSRVTLHYTQMCDFIQDCEDNSDENFCQYPLCSSKSLRCHNGQCIPGHQRCDGKINCYDGSDELKCWTKMRDYSLTDLKNNLPPVIVHTDNKGRLRSKNISESEPCPGSHFQCPQGYCLPIYLRCNGIPDCPQQEDEADCYSHKCLGFFRCYKSKICLSPEYVCDDIFHCPYFDDELICQRICPVSCHCQGLAFLCTGKISSSSYHDLRYLDARGSGMKPNDLRHNHLLIYLRLSQCGINQLEKLELPNLKHLDLSWNNLLHIDMRQFRSLQNLVVLVLSGNPLSVITNTASLSARATKLQNIDISHTHIKVYNGSTFEDCHDIRTLNISFSKLTMMTEEGFRFTPSLETLDVRGSPLIDFPRNLLRDLVYLKEVRADSYILCCEAMLPNDFNPRNCHAEQDLLSSCQDLLKSNSYRVFLWLFASLSLMGNAGSFAARIYLHSGRSGLSSFNVFVSCLSVADCLMGVYLTMIGAADLLYHGKYLWYNVVWKNSVPCKIAGFLSLMSSEVSAFLICLITLDRFLVLRFPFSRLHFNTVSALTTCGIVWVVGIVLAIIPLFPLTACWEFYSQTGICTPLPFMNSDHFKGHAYSFSVMIILNFVLFLLIATGQIFIYWSVRMNSISSAKRTGSRDATIARRLTTIVLSDFLCWFPIGLLGFLASSGVRISDEVNVAVAIFVMPLNSALNPFLYTFNVVMEKRLKAQEAVLMKRLESRMYTNDDMAPQISAFIMKNTALEQVKTWLSEQVLTTEDVLLSSTAIQLRTTAE